MNESDDSVKLLLLLKELYENIWQCVVDKSLLWQIPADNAVTAPVTELPATGPGSGGPQSLIITQITGKMVYFYP